jgi:hypothetical protein
MDSAHRYITFNPSIFPFNPLLETFGETHDQFTQRIQRLAKPVVIEKGYYKDFATYWQVIPDYDYNNKTILFGVRGSVAHPSTPQ